MAWRSRGHTHAELMASLKANLIITDDSVYKAMMAVDRGKYVSADAYADHPVPIGHGQTISAPHMHAAALQELKDHLKPGSSALDVGSGTGYLTVCMGHMVDVKGGGGRVTGIEYIENLVEQSIANVKSDDPELLNHKNMTIRVGDGWVGAPEAAPFDAIHVGAAASSIPQVLVDQLANGGKMILPVGPHNSGQVFTAVTKDMDGKVSKKELMDVMYVPLVKKT